MIKQEIRKFALTLTFKDYWYRIYPYPLDRYDLILQSYFLMEQQSKFCLSFTHRSRAITILTRVTFLFVLWLAMEFLPMWDRMYGFCLPCRMTQNDALARQKQPIVRASNTGSVFYQGKQAFHVIL